MFPVLLDKKRKIAPGKWTEIAIKFYYKQTTIDKTICSSSYISTFHTAITYSTSSTSINTNTIIILFFY